MSLIRLTKKGFQAPRRVRCQVAIEMATLTFILLDEGLCGKRGCWSVTAKFSLVACFKKEPKNLKGIKILRTLEGQQVRFSMDVCMRYVCTYIEIAG